MDRDGWKCRNCGMRNGLHCHHVIYRSEMGVDVSWNLHTVHQFTTKYTPERFSYS